MPCSSFRSRDAILGVERIHLERRRVDQCRGPTNSSNMRGRAARGRRPGTGSTRCTCGTPARARHRPAPCATCRPVHRAGAAGISGCSSWRRNSTRRRSRDPGSAETPASVRRSPASTRSSWLSRVMHMSRGLPLTSAEHDPHLPALQFQRTARSFGLVGLNLVHGIEHHHALGDLGRIIVERRRPARRRARFERSRSSCHCYFISSMTCFSSAGISGIGARDTSIPRRAPLRTTKLKVACTAVLVRDSPRGSVRRGSPAVRAPTA